MQDAGTAPRVLQNLAAKAKKELGMSRCEFVQRELVRGMTIAEQIVELAGDGEKCEDTLGKRFLDVDYILIGTDGIKQYRQKK